MGGLFGGKTTQTSTSTSDTGPSSFQKPYVTDLFNNAQANYGASKGTPYYQGETYASMSPAAQATLAGLKGYAGSAGLSSAGTLTNLGTSLTGAGGKALSAQDAYAAQAGQDATGTIIADAGRYADNPNITGQIDAVNRDVARGLSENTLPGIDRQATATGGINSSRAGIAAGVAQRGAAERMADTASAIRSGAWNNGIGLASGQYNARMAQLAQAAQGYSGLAGQGISALGAGTAAGYGAYGQMQGADALGQQDRQGQDTAAFNKWQGQDTRADDLLKRYQGIVGSAQWGQSGTSTGTNTQQNKVGLGAGLLGLATAGAGLAKSFGA